MNTGTNLHQHFTEIHRQVSKVVVGKSDEIFMLLTAMLANGHILIEDVPGVGKTTLIKALARSCGADFRRLQFTPDVLPSDITGVSIFDQTSQQFRFHHGPVMCNLLLADEINRASPKTQAALLECMEERQVSAEGITHKLPEPFLVMATQNPREFHGTFPLPESQMDRFMFSLSLGYPSAKEELQILERFQTENPLDSISPVIDMEDLIRYQEYSRQIHISPALRQYIVDIISACRLSPEIILGAGPRGTLALFKAAQAAAALKGRTYVLPEEVKLLALPVLRHRVKLKGSILPDLFIQETLSKIPVPLS